MRLLWDLTHAMNVRSKKMSRALGVTGPQRIVLRVIGQMPSCSATDVASALNMHPSTLTGILARLARERLIERKVDRSDRRRARLALTAKGKRVDRVRTGTAEAAIRRALSRADTRVVDATRSLLELMIGELAREDS
jgi:MarR family transcriptional regulator, organic hydroperoxide resistance regulator